MRKPIVSRTIKTTVCSLAVKGVDGVESLKVAIAGTWKNEDDLDKKKKKILDCILYHSAKDIDSLDLTPEMKVVMDADILDEIGILLISRVCLRTHNKNLSIQELIKLLDNKYAKIDRELALVKTKTGREMYIQKRKKLKEYIDALKIESAEFKL